MIGFNPLGEPIHDTLHTAVRGHAQIVAAITNQAELTTLKRQLRREEADRARLPRGAMGGTGDGPAGAPALE